MSVRQRGFAGLCVLAVGVFVFVWILLGAPAPLSMRILGFTAKEWPADMVAQMGSREYVVVTIELTNASKQSLIYWASGGGLFPEHDVLYSTPTGWKPRIVRFCGTGIEQYSFAPSQTVRFEAGIDKEKLCKVAFSYSDGRQPSRLWERLPAWLTQRLPWARGLKTVTTDVIDLRGATLPLVKAAPPFFKLPETAAVLESSAQNGDADAQFKLGGRYWTGSGVEKNATEAMRWYETAATNGNAEAAYSLGVIYEHGLSTQADEAKAVEWYRIAIRHGNSGAEERLRAIAKR